MEEREWTNRKDTSYIVSDGMIYNRTRSISDVGGTGGRN